MVVVAGYFSNHPPTLIAEAGGVIEPALAFRLAGPIMHGALAQASGGGAALTPIGVVDKADGNVTAKHTDGTSDKLAKGGTVYQGDVLETHDGKSASSSPTRPLLARARWPHGDGRDGL